MVKRILIVLLLILSNSAIGFAFDFHIADSLFLRREDNPENISRSRAIYNQALKSSNLEDKIYAVDRIGRLAYYEGELFTSQDEHSKRRKIFQDCQDAVENIAPEKLGYESVVYYYWKSACLAMWAKSAKPWSVPGRVSELEAAMNRGLELDSAYEGGGIHRVMGAVYLKSKMLSWVPGLGRFYDPQKALYHIDQAINLGPDYYNAYLVKAEILKELGRAEEGKRLLKEKTSELQLRAGRNTLPKGLEPESKILLQQMVALLKDW